MLERQAPRFVSAAEITRNFGMWQDRATQGPLIVTHHGRQRCVLLSIEAWQGSALENGAAPPAEVARIEHDLLSERIDAGFLALDAKLVIRGVNALGAMILGHAREMLVGTPFADAMPLFAEGPVGAQLRRTLRSGEEGRLAARHAEDRLRIHVFPWPEGVALTMRLAGEDDELERAERTAAALHAAIEAHGGIGTAELSVRGTIVSADAGFAAMAGFAASRLVGVRAVDLMALSHRARLGELIEAVLSGGDACAIGARLLVNGADERPIRIALAPVAEGFGAGGAVMVVS